MLRFLLRPLLLVLAGYGFYLGLLYVQQRSIMFPGVDLPADTTPPPHNASVLHLPASFGKARALMLRSPDVVGPAPAVLYFHGNYELAQHNLELLAPLTELGMHVLLVEYPGYAGSEGSPSRDSINEAATASYDWLLRQPDVDTDRIIAIGRSIGSGPASELSQSRRLRGVVLLSPYTSIADLAWGMAAPPWLIRDRFDNRAALRQFDGPTLIFHGRDDEIIPFSHSEVLASLGPSVRLVEMSGGHNDVDYFGVEFMHELQRFLRQTDILTEQPSTSVLN